MTAPPWRFSLASLFMIMTLIATYVAMAAHHPMAVVFAIIITSPFIFAASMAFLSNRSSPVVRHMLLALAILAAALLVLAGVAFTVALYSAG